jgi:hypothetical protein
VLGQRRWAAGRFGVERLVAVLCVLAAGVHAVGWYANARRSALGTDGTWLFLSSSEWSPPGGWFTWLALVAVAIALVTGAGVACWRYRRHLADDVADPELSAMAG